MNATLPYGRVLGMKLALVDYAGAFRHAQALAASGQVAAVAAANTHLAGEYASSAEFKAAMDSFELVVPDGMPLVWSLRLDGHELEDRVYGPYLLRHCLAESPAELRHFFFGGTQVCLDQLVAKAQEMNPGICIAGSLSPRFGQWSESEEQSMIDKINAARPDFIWVALGGVKQETWIARHRHRFDRGVLLAVGDAFALVAGLRSYAPAWMQRCGLTWFYRLLQEPRRLLARYASYHGRFVLAFLRERWAMTHGAVAPGPVRDHS